MKTSFKKSFMVMLILLTLIFSSFSSIGVTPAKAAGSPPSYYPSGPQANVDESQLVGWELCWSSLYNSTDSLTTVLNDCNGDYLLFAGRPVGSSVFDVVAAGPRADVLFDTGTGNTPHDANGVGWYYNSSYSWGFAKAGDPINRSVCDVTASPYESGPNGNLRLCWHTSGGDIVGGWRSGNNVNLNSSTTFERFIYQPALDSGTRLFATTGAGTASTLVELDPTTGALLGTIGPVGYRVNGLDYDPISGNLYATTSTSDPTFPRGLLKIDMTTGAGTAIGLTNPGFDAITNLRADSSGTLFAWAEGPDDLVTIDPITGVATVVGDSSMSTYAYGMSFDRLGKLYFVNGGDGGIYTVDTVTGAGTYTGVTTSLAHHGDFQPDTGKYWGIDSTGGGTKNLLVVNVATGAIEQTLPTVNDLFTVAFVKATWGKAYVRSIAGGDPWGMTTNQQAMDSAFGSSNWSDLRYETVDPAELFSPTYNLIFLEGSDANATEMEAFINANQALMEAWVADGGRIFLNAAPNEDDGMAYGFGGVQLNFNYPSTASSTGIAVDPSHLIFNGPFTPAGTSFTGNYFSHASVSGGGIDIVLTGDGGLVPLAEKAWGSGCAMFGGMTTTNWHSPQPNAQNLRANILSYLNVGCDTQIDVHIGGSLVAGGPFNLLKHHSTRVSFASVNNGPVQLSSSALPLIGAERVIYKVNGTNTSFSEMMALPNSQLNTTYWLPWYNNVDLDTQLRFGNVSGSTATVHVFVGGVEMSGSPFVLTASGAGQSTRVSFAGINSGPVQIVSDVNIVAAERVIYNVNGTNTSFSEMMALPASQLNMTYWLPWYNNVDLDTQLRLGNVSGSTATVHVFIGGVEMSGSPFTLLTGASTRASFAGINSGPVQIVSNVNIVAAERVIYKVNNLNTSFSEMMALPASQLNTTYWLPWYNNVDLDTQLRFGNVSGSTATVHVFVGGVEMSGSPFTLLTGASTRVSFAGVNNGPVQIVSNVNIVAAERVIYKVNNVNTSFSEMMALPNNLLNTTYWLPWYNNVNLDTQLRFGVP